MQLTTNISLSKINDIIRINNIEDNFAKTARLVGVSRPVVRKYIRLAGLHKGNIIKVKKYTLDINYFKEINTSNKAYILGFIYADGCNTRKGLQIGISEEDIEVLNFIKQEVNISTPLRFIPKAKNTWKNKWELVCSSVELSNQLTLLGSPPAKSLILKFPHFLNNDLLPHFIRGFFDGDGSISKRGGSYRLNFACGSINFVKDLCKYLKQETGYDINVYSNKRNLCLNLLTGKQDFVCKIIKIMYPSENYFGLTRKKQLCLNALKEKGGKYLIST